MVSPKKLLLLVIVLLSLGLCSGGGSLPSSATSGSSTTSAGMRSVSSLLRRRRRRSPSPPPPAQGYACVKATGMCSVLNTTNTTAAECQASCAPPPGPCNAPKLVNATEKTLNSVLKLVTTELDHAWPAIVNKSHLDPYTNATHDLTYDLDHKDGCDEICGAQLASCHSFGLRLHSVNVLGLSSLQLGEVALTSLLLHANVSCATPDQPNGTNGSASVVACGFNGGATANASLKVTAKVNIESSGGGAETPHFWHRFLNSGLKRVIHKTGSGQM